jgi:signal peptidase II
MLNKKYAFLLFSTLIIADQLSKLIIRHFGGFYICNEGVAFGLKLPLILFYFLILTFLSLVYVSNNWKLKIINQGLILMLSGAFSNIIDRFIFGCVIDFIKLPFWPLFNLADILICLGAIMIITENINQKK